MTMLEPGKKAPAFRLEGSDGKEYGLKDFAEKTLILYFYPRDNTPGCTTEAQEFRDALPKLQKLGAIVVGVSPDSKDSHCKFQEKYDLPFLLLSDPNHKAMEAYGAYGEKVMYGKKSVGVIRTTVIIDPKGKIDKVFPRVRVKGHVEKVVAHIEASDS